jgi:hypothetical protein
MPDIRNSLKKCKNFVKLPLMRNAVTTIIISCVLLSLCYSSESEQKLTQETKEILYACGYNSLYLFLKLQGTNVFMDEVKSQVNIGENGTSFYDLKIAAVLYYTGCSATINAYNKSRNNEGGRYAGKDSKSCGGDCGGFQERVSPAE